MPEHSEIRITSEYINSICKNKIFCQLKISSITQNKIDTDLPFNHFFIQSFSRGKEMKLEFHPIQGEFDNEKPRTLIIGFGMTGRWMLLTKNEFEKTSHIHLYLVSDDQSMFLCFQDVRRFGRWNWGDWSLNRGPDPISEFDLFKANILNNLDKKVFEGRIMEVLLDQKYFNGIGNYLRAEILSRINIVPFLSARDIIKNNKNFFELIKKVIHESYELGGAQLRDWNNPFGKDKKGFMDWLQVYGKGESILDKQKRRFWYLKKWKEHSILKDLMEIHNLTIEELAEKLEVSIIDIRLVLDKDKKMDDVIITKLSHHFKLRKEAFK